MMETQSAHPPPTRYKTVHRANPPAQHPNAAPSVSIPSPHHHQQPGNSSNDVLTRSRSRYRRRPTLDTTVASASIPTIPVPQLPKEFQRRNQPALAQPSSTVLSPQESLPPRTALSTSPTAEQSKNHLSPVTQTPTAGFGGFFGQTERVSHAHPLL